MDQQPQIVILDIKGDLAQFEERVTPLLHGTERTPKELVEELWMGFRDKRVMDEYIWSSIDHALMEEEYDGTLAPEKGELIASEMADLAMSLSYRLNFNGLYGTEGLLPYELKWDPRYGAYLKFDQELQKELRCMRNDSEVDDTPHLQG